MLFRIFLKVTDHWLKQLLLLKMKSGKEFAAHCLRASPVEGSNRLLVCFSFHCQISIKNISFIMLFLTVNFFFQAMCFRKCNKIKNILREYSLGLRFLLVNYVSTLLFCVLLKVFSIVSRYADRLVEKLGETYLNKAIDIRQYVDNLLKAFIWD